jgi:hypothetical protein
MDKLELRRSRKGERSLAFLRGPLRILCVKIIWSVGPSSAGVVLP